MREMSTRYGRNNIGFLWVIVEPLIFAGGVSVIWSMIRPPYEHGMKLVPFLLTGYMPLIMIRQTVGYTVGGVRANQSLLYHRQITPLHVFIGRALMETLGVSFAACVVFFILYLAGIMDPPKDFLDLTYVYGGWLLVAWTALRTHTAGP